MPNTYSRDDFENAGHALCILELKDLLILGNIYKVLDTGYDTVEVKDEKRNFEPYPMEHFTPFVVRDTREDEKCEKLVNGI